MLRVKFVTKNVEETHPEFRLLTDRAEDFANFQKAMDFIRNLKNRLHVREVLLGKPEIEVA
jgi:hypothetical protein